LSLNLHKPIILLMTVDLIFHHKHKASWIHYQISLSNHPGLSGLLLLAKLNGKRSSWDPWSTRKWLHVYGCAALWYWLMACAVNFILIVVSFELRMTHNFVWFISVKLFFINYFPTWIWKIIHCKMCENLVCVASYHHWSAYNTYIAKYLKPTFTRRYFQTHCKNC